MKKSYLEHIFNADVKRNDAVLAAIKSTLGTGVSNIKITSKIWDAYEAHVRVVMQEHGDDGR